MVKVVWMKTLAVIWLPMLEDGRMSLARMTHKAMVTSKRKLWATRRRMVDVLTPRLSSFGLKKEEMGPDGGWDWAAGWLPPFALAIGGGPGSEDAGPGSLSAGCLAGMNVW
jgi:hypothetical protein